MKVLIVMFLGTVIAQGGSPGGSSKLECWKCDEKWEEGKYMYPCNHREKFTLQDCEKESKTMCLDVFDEENHFLSKGCADEDDLKNIKANHRPDSIYDVCYKPKCNVKTYTNFLVEKHVAG